MGKQISTTSAPAKVKRQSKRHVSRVATVGASSALLLAGLLRGAMAWMPASPVHWLGLPPATSITAAHEQRVMLGERLFFDTRLSADGKVSCATCHQPDLAFTDGLRVARGINGASGTRNTPSLLNAAFNNSQFWEGRRASLELQALDPFLNPREHGLKNIQALLAQLNAIPEYAKVFQMAFPASSPSIQPEQIAQALSAFERQLVAGDSAFDRYQYGNDSTALSPAALRGLRFFMGIGQCVSCHRIDAHHALFTDQQFHRLSIGSNRIEARLAEITTRWVEAQNAGRNLDQTVLSDEEIAELGRFTVTLDPADIGKFRTPSLRNVARTAPYMHDGSVATLEAAVDIEVYYRNTQNGARLVLSATERADLVAFLKSLDSASLPSLKASNAL